MRIRMRMVFVFFLVLLIASCSTRKNTLITRTYHQVTAKYNIYFNGRESFRNGVRRAEQQFRYDYNKILPVFLYTDPEIARSFAPEMDRAIDKASRVIANKSITARPKETNGLFGGRDSDFYRQTEYNRWVRESYLLAGKAHFYKHDFASASQAFLFIIREYSINNIRHEARVWLARTYSERGRFNEARLLFEQMLSDPGFPSGLNGELYSSIADYHLKQDRFDEAILNLEKTLEYSGSKDRRSRYNFILAQLNERTGNFDKAYEYYGRVIRMTPPYEMVFNARIKQAGVFRAGSGDFSRMINDLEKMIRDEKNREYLDQIYYALGNIYLINNDEQNAIRHYAMSASAPGLVPSQKAVTYLALAGIFYGHPDYMRAQAYYDSALMNMGPDFPGYKEISEKNRVLNDLVINKNIYILEDSVQLLAAMTETERNRRIDEIIEHVRKEEEDARQQEQLARQTPQYQAARTAQMARSQAERSGGGSWYFYNQSAVTFGENEFESLWGNRRLEDNWRRSDRQVISEGLLAVEGEEEFDADVEEVADAQSREYYLRDIPLSEGALELSHKRIEEALFNMGFIYSDDIQDYGRSAEAYEELVRRYPEGEYAMPALYNLYSVSMLDNNPARADNFKSIIVERYPDSPYAGMLTNPEYFREYEQRMRAAEQYYEETFNLFREDKYDLVIERAMNASDKWPESNLIPRFEYLKTLAYGSRGNMPEFRKRLSDYLSAYPGTEMAENATEFLAYLDDDFAEVVIREEIVFSADIYQPAEEGVHFFVLIVDENEELINRMVFNIVNFNVDNFARLNLNVNSQVLSSNLRILRVEGFSDAYEALQYRELFSDSDQVFSETGRKDFQHFVISAENYGIFIEDKNINSYLKFFKDEYPVR